MVRMLARTFGTSGAAAFRSSRRNRFLISLSSMRRSSRLIRRRSPLSRRPIVITGLLAVPDEDPVCRRAATVGQLLSGAGRRAKCDGEAEGPELQSPHRTRLQAQGVAYGPSDWTRDRLGNVGHAHGTVMFSTGIDV